jgi:hypothetical protein
VETASRFLFCQVVIRMEANSLQAASGVCAHWQLRLLFALLATVLSFASLSFAQDPFASERHENPSSFDFKLDEGSVNSPDAAEFDQWQDIIEEDCEPDNTVNWRDPSVKPVDWMRHFGLRHSSSDGRYIDRGLPLEGTSWLNRPYHADWFIGTLLGDDMTQSVNLSNEVFAGVRIGYDFDYYWGLDWRFGWSNPDLDVDGVTSQELNGSYFISDLDLKYYPWGDTKIRPYWLLGAGLARIEYRDETNVSQNVTLATLPLGVGVEFPQFPWLAWRLEVLDNLAFGADGVETLNNFSLTAGMEWRFGVKPQSYWPWRPGRKSW